ncbi:MAG: N-acetylmuramoyl-L-alanine amidase [Gammaproteobacteria bacterium]
MKKLLTGMCLWLAGQGLTLAAQVEFRNVRVWDAPDHTRVVFDTSGPVTHTVFALQDPERLVIDVPAAQATDALKTHKQKGGLVTDIRTAHNKQDVLRIVLDLAQATRPRSFTLKPGGQYGHRLVVDLYSNAAASEVAPTKSVADKTSDLRELIIAIDAGHGGEDPGAIGKHGTREKHVVLSIAQRLARLVEEEPGMRPVLIRQGDYYIGLRQRINKARKHKADLFISIHADGFRDRSVRGSSVYVLSRRGASSEMGRWLAAKENAADLVGGVSLDDKDDLLAEVLLDLSQTATIEASFDLAGNLLDELKRVGRPHKSTVQQAGFVVLKSPDIPSILVETAFISNPAEESKLRDKKHQQTLARAMLSGIRDYFGRYPPPGTLLSAREHIIQRGDTLSHIAARYNVSLTKLRGFNSLKSDSLRVGQLLRIPPADS